MSRSIYKLICPHCQYGLRVSNSVSQHPLLRVTYMPCTNVNCDATFRGQMEIIHTQSPSTCPNPEVNLPLADSAIRQAAMVRKQSKQMDIDDVLIAVDQ